MTILQSLFVAAFIAVFVVAVIAASVRVAVFAITLGKRWKMRRVVRKRLAELVQ